MDLDAINKEFYNAHGGGFDKIPFEELLPKLILRHVAKLGSRILEIGSGAGALALWLSHQGHKVVCIEPAEKPAEMAREKGLTVIQAKLQDYEADQKFDCVLAISSLIHIPRSQIPGQIKKIAASLEKEGVAIVSFIEGAGEGYEDPTNIGRMRYFSKLSESELRKALSVDFLITEMHRIAVKRMQQQFLIFVLKRK